MITFLLIIHMLVAVALLGALTHQAISVWWPASPGAPTLARSYRAVRSSVYTNTVIVMFILVAIMGALLYPNYRISVLPFMYKNHLKSWGGVFELKEHLIAIGLGILPLYWYLWKKVPAAEFGRTRAVLTAILAFAVWYSFIVGHLINNIKGFGA